MFGSRHIAYVFVLILAGVTMASANVATVLPTGTGSWYPGTTANAFFANYSMDGSHNNCHVGYWLNDTDWDTGPGGVAGCGGSFASNAGGPGSAHGWSFLAANSGAGTPVGWTMKASDSINPVVLKLELAGQALGNRFGYYTTDGTGAVLTSTELFSGGAAPEATETISISSLTHFGFYHCYSTSNCNATSSNAFLSGTAYSSTSGKSGKIALFSEEPPNPGSLATQTFWVGVEDLAGTTSEKWGDFNDMLIKMTVVPEPGFYGALALMLSGLYVVVQRRRKNENKS